VDRRTGQTVAERELYANRSVVMY
ncbi:MAG: hypothetical protein RLZZ459_2070, partial [Cyanobacteriota bacterium]